MEDAGAQQQAQVKVDAEAVRIAVRDLVIEELRSFKLVRDVVVDEICKTLPPGVTTLQEPTAPVTDEAFVAVGKIEESPPKVTGVPPVSDDVSRLEKTVADLMKQLDEALAGKAAAEAALEAALAQLKEQKAAAPAEAGMVPAPATDAAKPVVAEVTAPAAATTAPAPADSKSSDDEVPPQEAAASPFAAFLSCIFCHDPMEPLKAKARAHVAETLPPILRRFRIDPLGANAGVPLREGFPELDSFTISAMTSEISEGLELPIDVLREKVPLDESTTLRQFMGYIEAAAVDHAVETGKVPSLVGSKVSGPGGGGAVGDAKGVGVANAARPPAPMSPPTITATKRAAGAAKATASPKPVMASVPTPGRRADAGAAASPKPVMASVPSPGRRADAGAPAPTAQREETASTVPPLTAEELLGELDLSHLLASVDWKSVLAALDGGAGPAASPASSSKERTALLAVLKDSGVSKLPDRQKIATAITKARREGRILKA
jgi:hypothetical protein